MNNLSPLVKVDSVAALTRKPVGVIYAMADGEDLIEGRYQWVWNVATDAAGKIRDLRFWTGEIIAPERQANLKLEQVINFILPPSRREYPAGEVCQLLQIRPITLTGLRTELNGALRAHSGFYPRQGLVEFLQNRWLGRERTADKKTEEAKV